MACWDASVRAHVVRVAGWHARSFPQSLIAHALTATIYRTNNNTPPLQQVLKKHGYKGPVNSKAWSRQPAFIQVRPLAAFITLLRANPRPVRCRSFESRT